MTDQPATNPTTPQGKLSKAELAAYRKRLKQGWDFTPVAAQAVEELLDHADAQGAHIAALEAQLAALKAPGAVDAEEMAKEARLEWYRSGPTAGGAWESVSEGCRRDWRNAIKIVIDHITPVIRSESAAERAALRNRIEGHVQEIKQRIVTEANLRRQIAEDHEFLTANNYWRWQGDASDFSESLTCQVVMTADQLRTVLNKLAATEREIANYQTYGQGGASFQESQWIERLAQAEQSRDEKIEQLETALAAERAAAGEMMAIVDAIVNSLLNQCLDDFKYSSDPSAYLQHGCGKAIITMGEAAIPSLLKRLELRDSHCFVFLHQITGELPEIPEGSLGVFSAIIDAWLEWGRKRTAALASPAGAEFLARMRALEAALKYVLKNSWNGAGCFHAAKKAFADLDQEQPTQEGKA